MGSIAARHARTVLAHVERILAIELLVAAQALDPRLAAPTGRVRGPASRRRGNASAAVSSHLDRDREPGPDLAAALDLVRTGALAGLASA